MTEALVVVGIVCFPGKGVNEKWLRNGKLV
jgi:hypothetical protein